MRILTGSGGRLVDGYRGIICDLDGVVYRGRVAVPGAVDTLMSVAQAGVDIAFATNNAARPADEVLRHLRALGIDIPRATVITSAQAAAAYVADLVPAGSSVLAVGGPAVAAALREQGMHVVTRADARRAPLVVVQGAGADVSWSDLAEAAYAVQAGAAWVATNRDMTIPMTRGLAPGNGTLVQAVSAACRAEPVVVGKPGPKLYELALQQLRLKRSEVLVVGDRLDTDIAGAHAARMDALLVLSGVHGVEDLRRTPAGQRPTFIAESLVGLLSVRT